MSAAGEAGDPVQAKSADKDVVVTVRGHSVRVSFETVALSIIVVIVVLGCVIGFWSEALAARVVQLKDAIMDFLGVLGTMVGFSFTRGHMDQRLKANGDN